ncbi:MAG: winged helix-turn-helix domain-containing tetratricopeptide repeat protein [Amaricoccus sp.]
MPGQRLAFGPFELNLDNGTLLRGGERVPVGRRGILLLEALLRRQGEILTKGELMDAAWLGAAVEESNLSVQVALLRKALGERGDGSEWIGTVPRIGYCLAPDAAGAALPAAPALRPSLAVLPFANLSSDPEQEFFAEGLADEIAATLAKLPGLRLVARSSSFAFKGRRADVRQIARELDARYVAEGSVQRSGGRVRIVAQLGDGATGGQLWADRYDRDLEDVFAIQGEVAGKIGAAISAAVRPVEPEQWPRIAAGGTSSAPAFDCFLRGRSMQRGATQNAGIFRRTVALFHEAIAHDPGYAAPYAALAMAHAHNHFNRWDGDPAASLAAAEGFAREATSRDPADPFGRAVAGLVSLYQRDLDGCAARVGEALALDPNFAPALAIRAGVSLYSGDPRAAIQDLERAIRFDPYFSHNYLHHLGVAHIVAGDSQTAATIFRERILLAPEADMSRALLAAALGNLGDLDEAHAVWQELLAILPTTR